MSKLRETHEEGALAPGVERGEPPVSTGSRTQNGVGRGVAGGSDGGGESSGLTYSNALDTLEAYGWRAADGRLIRQSLDYLRQVCESDNDPASSALYSSFKDYINWLESLRSVRATRASIWREISAVLPSTPLTLRLISLSILSVPPVVAALLVAWGFCALWEKILCAQRESLRGNLQSSLAPLTASDAPRRFRFASQADPLILPPIACSSSDPSDGLQTRVSLQAEGERGDSNEQMYNPSTAASSASLASFFTQPQQSADSPEVSVPAPALIGYFPLGFS